MKDNDYPQEVFFDIENEDYIVGRVMIDKIKDYFTSEISLVQKENNKIVQHVAGLYQYSDYDEILKVSIDKLSKFLKQTTY